MNALSKNATVLNTLVQNLKRKDFILIDEGTLTRYLGVDVVHQKNKGYELNQTFLIQ